jgi:protein TonB
MNYAEQQRNPGRHAVGITAVVLLHVLIVWALVSGLARTVVEVVKGPIEVKVIEEIIKKPPPPPEVVPPPPKLAAPPPPFIPPPEINIAPPPTPAPAITAVTQDAPPAPQAPVIAKVPEAAPPQPAVRSARVVCPNYTQVMSSIVYPREAIKENIEGEVIVSSRSLRAAGQGHGNQVVDESRLQPRVDGGRFSAVLPGAGRQRVRPRSVSPHRGTRRRTLAPPRRLS